MSKVVCLLDNELDIDSTYLGAKTKNLYICQTLGLPVPAFVAIASCHIETLYSSSDARQHLAAEVQQKLPADRYVIRSSALIEDTSDTSFAGQFTTICDILGSDIGPALQEVIAQAHDYLNGDLSLFSIIIQKHIPATYSGVVFTRSPQGDRQMVIEYHAGAGEDLVSGRISPQQINLYWNENLEHRKDIPKRLQQSKLVTISKQLEQHFGSPQDIERCWQAGQLSILQTRPITTIDKKTHTTIKTLEHELPMSPFYLEQTELSEIAPRPTPLTLDLLQHIYKPNGPVHQTYKKFKIRYETTDFLKIIGNQLYVDKNAELHSLFPAYTYAFSRKKKSNRKSKNRIKKTLSLHNIGITLTNYAKLNAIQATDEGIAHLRTLLYTELKQTLSSETVQDRLVQFLETYQLIFEINLYTSLLSQKTMRLLKEKNNQLPKLLLLVKEDDSSVQIACPDGLIGNSLDLSDRSNFVEQISQAVSVEKSIDACLREWGMKKSIRKKLCDAIPRLKQLYGLREQGRWLMLKHKAHFYHLLHTYATQQTIEEDLLAFCTFQELLEGTYDTVLLQAKKEAYENYLRHTFPPVLTSSYIETPSVFQGVAQGIATGKLVSIEQFKNKQDTGKYIIYTQTLDPSLASHFDAITGIISYSGGLLSHLAIVAREAGIPVIVGVREKDISSLFGTLISIDGVTGNIQQAT